MLARFIVLAIGLLAQVLGIDADQSQWSELGIATLFVWGTVELLRGSILKSVDGVAVHLLAAIVGIAFGLAFGIGEIITGTVFEWVVFGVQATFVATLGDLVLKKAAGKQLAAPSET